MWPLCCSEEEEKGSDCIPQFKKMQECFQQYPELYKDYDEDDEAEGGGGGGGEESAGTTEQEAPKSTNSDSTEQQANSSPSPSS